jgi:hypothetical protein
VTEPEQAPDQTPESLPPSARRTLEAHFEAGWPTPGVPDWLSGGYVTKERLMTTLLIVADYLDRATGHPDAALETQDASDAPERASA